MEAAAAALSSSGLGGAGGGGIGSSLSSAAVRYWTDYLKVLLPPASVFTLPGLWHGSAPFSGWGDGAPLMAPGAEVGEEVLVLSLHTEDTHLQQIQHIQ